MCHCVNSYNIDLFVFSPRTDAIKDQACFVYITDDVFENKIWTFLRKASGKLAGQERDVRPSGARSEAVQSLSILFFSRANFFLQKRLPLFHYVFII